MGISEKIWEMAGKKIVKKTAEKAFWDVISQTNNTDDTNVESVGCPNQMTEEELLEELENVGLSYEDICQMDYQSRIEAFASVGLDYFDYEELFEDIYS